VRVDGLELQAQDLAAATKNADCVVIVTDHRSIDYAALVRDAQLIVDTRNALKSFRSSNIVRL
jgi:UDP-N-acetyl-D-glucosamine dehydrogenase